MKQQLHLQKPVFISTARERGQDVGVRPSSKTVLEPGPHIWTSAHASLAHCTPLTAEDGAKHTCSP